MIYRKVAQKSLGAYAIESNTNILGRTKQLVENSRRGIVRSRLKDTPPPPQLVLSGEVGGWVLVKPQKKQKGDQRGGGETRYMKYESASETRGHYLLQLW